jgi:hypothetical protein
MTRLSLAFLALVLLFCLGYSLMLASWPVASPLESEKAFPPVEDIVSQLEGHHCRYAVEPLDACRLRPTRGFFEWLFSRFEDRWTCPTGAARCLSKMTLRSKPAVPALLRALESGGKDYDTGDGVIPVRSSVIEALGHSGDERAIEPLAKVLNEPEYTFVALEALSALGPVASRQAAEVVVVLKSRMADEQGMASACQKAIVQLEYRRATEAIVERIKREHPEFTRFTIPPTEHAAEIKKLDRGSFKYRQDREGACRDLVGEAAIRTLAVFACSTCITQIISALTIPALALQAAWEIERMNPLPPLAIEPLKSVLKSEQHGPLAKEVASRILKK